MPATMPRVMCTPGKRLVLLRLLFLILYTTQLCLCPCQTADKTDICYIWSFYNPNFILFCVYSTEHFEHLSLLHTHTHTHTQHNTNTHRDTHQTQEYDYKHTWMHPTPIQASRYTDRKSVHTPQHERNVIINFDKLNLMILNYELNGKNKLFKIQKAWPIVFCSWAL